MKHFKQLPPGARKAVIALAIIAVAYPAPIGLLVQHIAALGLAIAAILLLRIHPAGSHKALTAARVHHDVASVITGHKPTQAPPIKHAPATGPQIPVN